jgi:DNA-binding CsgD family transcriptional regulator
MIDTNIHSLASLPNTDRKLLELILKGSSGRAIAQSLGYKEGTTRVYLHSLYKRIGVKSKTSAGAAWALGQFASTTSATVLVDTFNSSPLEIKVEAARALLRIAEPQIPHLIDLLKNGDHSKRDGLSWVLARTGQFNPSDLVVGADDNLRKWMSYVVGYGKDKFVQGDVESICKADPQVYFAASVLWQLVASWVNDLREY